MALQRFDSRSRGGAQRGLNAIEHSLPHGRNCCAEAQRERAKEMIADYVQLRVDASTVDSDSRGAAVLG